MPVHLSVRAMPGRLLFRTHREAGALWERLVAGLDRLLALCLMPNHVHIVSEEPEERLRAALSGYARWRNHQRGERGPVFEPHGSFQVLADAEHLRRTVRYVHLNPPRKGLAEDPLTWPWSTHRDAVGLSYPAAIERRANAGQFHRYVSSDPTVSLTGTELPTLIHQDFSLEQVADAVAGVCRVSRTGIADDLSVQRLAVQAAWFRGFKSLADVSAAFGCSRASVWRWTKDLRPGLACISDPALRACVLTAGDPRFHALPIGDLRSRWGPYRLFD